MRPTRGQSQESFDLLAHLMLLKLAAWRRQDCQDFRFLYRAERDLRAQLAGH